MRQICSRGVRGAEHSLRTASGILSSPGALKGLVLLIRWLIWCGAGVVNLSGGGGGSESSGRPGSCVCVVERIDS